MERLRIEFLRREISRPRKILRVGFFLYVKCPHGCLFVYGCPIGDKLLVLCRILQSHVGPEEAVDEFAFLVLTPGNGESGQE